MSCPICDDPKIDFYNIMKKYCSDMNKIVKDICKDHKQPFVTMGIKFAVKDTGVKK